MFADDYLVRVAKEYEEDFDSFDDKEKEYVLEMIKKKIKYVHLKPPLNSTERINTSLLAKGMCIYIFRFKNEFMSNFKEYFLNTDLFLSHFETKGGDFDDYYDTLFLKPKQYLIPCADNYYVSVKQTQQILAIDESRQIVLFRSGLLIYFIDGKEFRFQSDVKLSSSIIDITVFGSLIICSCEVRCFIFRMKKNGHEYEIQYIAKLSDTRVIAFNDRYFAAQHAEGIKLYEIIGAKAHEIKISKHKLVFMASVDDTTFGVLDSNSEWMIFDKATCQNVSRESKDIDWSWHNPNKLKDLCENLGLEYDLLHRYVSDMFEYECVLRHVSQIDAQNTLQQQDDSFHRVSLQQEESVHNVRYHFNEKNEFVRKKVRESRFTELTPIRAFPCPYEQIVETFGEPEKIDGDKIMVMWNFEDHSNDWLQIYDYKKNSTELGRNALQPEEIKFWVLEASSYGIIRKVLVSLGHINK